MDVLVASMREPHLFEFLGAGEGPEVNPVPRCECAFFAPVPARGVAATELVSVAVGVIATCRRQWIIGGEFEPEPVSSGVGERRAGVVDVVQGDILHVRGRML